MFLQRVCILIPCLVLSIIPQTVQFSIGSSNFSPRYGPKKCSYLRERGMIAVDCYGLDLTVVPQNIRTDIEVCFLFKLSFVWMLWGLFLTKNLGFAASFKVCNKN